MDWIKRLLIDLHPDEHLIEAVTRYDIVNDREYTEWYAVPVVGKPKLLAVMKGSDHVDRV